MDWLTFIAELVKALAWPSCIVIAVLLFRQPLYDLIPLLKKLKYKELELEFAREVFELQREVAESIPSEPTSMVASPSDSDRYFKLAALSPRAAILEVWLAVETASVRALSSLYSVPPLDGMRSAPDLGSSLKNSNLIDESQFNIFQRLRGLRNKAAHAEELALSEEDARHYVDLAMKLVAHLNQ
ncbi:hypothetical protein [Chitinolyticbacter albus]|uniref:hypothetical protein n=1 Tax=Chitinolyticbacter albus TaxID=2961951 RepID=UPI00210C92B5|nr:hypothetical protein [Chitinolyticbacter albus]